LCEWHALAKLRLHHDMTLQLLDDATVALGSQFRKFQVETCNEIATFELPGEADARARKALKTASSGASTSVSSTTDGTTVSTTRRPKSYSLSTPKYHALGHYASQIRRFGTVDSFTSEIGETNHPVVKTWYKRTDRRNYSAQIATIERQRARLTQLKVQYNSDQQLPAANAMEADVEEPTAGLTGPESTHHHIGGSNRFLNLHASFVSPAGLEDPALIDFIPKLKRFLLPRILHRLAPALYPVHANSIGSASEDEPSWRSVDLKHNRLYCHNIMRVSYTTYDIRRQADIIRISSEPCVMTLDTRKETHSVSHPYRYARVLQIFHADVCFVGTLQDGQRNYNTHRIDFLWVRWFCLAPSGGSEPSSLERLQFEPLGQSNSFAFLDPNQVIRTVHLIPQFAKSKLPKTNISAWTGEKQQWRYYYVNRYADRDLYMRYHVELAIGHCGIRARCPEPDMVMTERISATAPEVFGPIEAPADADSSDGEEGEPDDEGTSDAEGEGDD
ncbi:hypothetical protein BKA70DRAFT_1116289, partial [Coprinopsis sp. MPI-PUGE-AT-0042]